MPKLPDQGPPISDSSPEKTGVLRGATRNKILNVLVVAGAVAVSQILSGCVGPEKNPTAGIEQQQRKFEVSRLADLAGLTVLKLTTPKGWTAYYLFSTENVERLSLDQTEQFMNFFKGKKRIVAKLRFGPKESLEDIIFASLPDDQVLFGMKTKKKESQESKMKFYHAKSFGEKGLSAYALTAKNKFTTRGNPIHGKSARIIPGPDLASSKYIPGSKDKGKFIPKGEGVLLGSLPAVIPPKGAAADPTATAPEKTSPPDLKPVSRKSGFETPTSQLKILRKSFAPGSSFAPSRPGKHF